MGSRKAPGVTWSLGWSPYALYGKIHSLSGGGSASFSGKKWHGAEPCKGDRTIAICYTPNRWEILSHADRAVLTEVDNETGFHRTQQCSEADVKAFRSMVAPAEECTFFAESGLLTIEEKRTLDQLSDQVFPERKQKPQLGSEPMNTQLQQHIHQAYRSTTSKQACVGDVVDERDRVHEGLGLGSEGYERIDDIGAPETRVEDSTSLKPCDLSFLPGNSAEDQAVKDLWKHCREGVCDRTAEPDLRARGHRRPHRKIFGPDIENGVVSVDLSGPHKQSYAGNKYAVVVCANLADGCDLPFVRSIPNKEAKTVTDALCDVLTQLVSLAGGDQITFRIHSDQGKEFVARIAQERLKVFNHFRTFAVPYSHQSNGRVEQLIDTLKSSTGTFLLSGQLDVRFWDEVMLRAAKLKRMRALNVPIPKDLPIPGDYVLARQSAEVLPDFEGRTERGVFLGLSDTVSNGSKILVQRGDRLFVRYARLPILINRVKPRWRVVTKPDTAEHMWVSDSGQVSWDAPAPDQILTLEQRQGADIPHPEEVVWKLRQLLERTRTPESTKEIFNLFGHGVLMTPDSVDAVAARAGVCAHGQTAKGTPSSSEWIQGKRCWICHRSVAECHQAKLDSIPREAKGYQLDTADVETTADEQARLMTEIASAKASAESMDCGVFFEGTLEEQAKWFRAAQDEMAGMGEKRVLESLNRDTLKQDLGLGPDEAVPRILPTKLVTSRKPDEVVAIAATSKKPCIQEAPWRAKVRLCACGNFELPDGSEVTTSNGRKLSPLQFCLAQANLANHAEACLQGVGINPPMEAVAAYHVHQDGSADGCYDIAVADCVLEMIKDGCLS